MEGFLDKEKDKLPGSHLNDFKEVIEITQKLIGKVDFSNFFSPYSIVPIISQILGLETPMMGNGTSPYSIISIISQMGNRWQMLCHFHNQSGGIALDHSLFVC